ERVRVQARTQLPLEYTHRGPGLWATGHVRGQHHGGGRRGQCRDIDLHRDSPRCLPESECPPRDDRDPRGNRGHPRGGLGVRRMAPLWNAEAGAAAAGADIGTAPDPTTGPDASVAPDASAEGAGPARHDVTARPSEGPLAQTSR